MSTETEGLAEAILTEVVDSFEKLELVVKLPPAGAAIAAADLEAATGLAPQAFAEGLVELVADGVIVRTGSDLAIAPGRWARHCAAVATLHREDRLHLVTMMSRASLARLRVKTARAFADAFVLRSKKGRHDG